MRLTDYLIIFLMVIVVISTIIGINTNRKLSDMLRKAEKGYEGGNL